MFGRTLVAALILLAANQANAQAVKDPESVKTIDGRTILLKPDGTYSIEPLRRTEPAGGPLKVERWLFDQESTKYGQDSIRFMPYVRNMSLLEVVGFKFRARFMNAFKEVLFEFNGSSEESVRPNEVSMTRLFYKFEDNPFIKNEPYDKLLPLVLGSKANIDVTITSVAFADGTVSSIP